MFGYIYKITNLINGKLYIGKHKYNKPELDPKYIASGKLINLAIEKYGIDNFQRELIACADTEEELNALEKQYIKQFNSMVEGYNLTDGGDGISNPSQQIIEINRQKHLGKTQSDETKDKRNKKLKSIVHTQDWCNKISNALSGVSPSEQTVQASRQRHQNTKWFNDGVQSYMLKPNDPLIVENQLVLGRLPFNHISGIKRTPEQCAKYGDAVRGRQWYNNGAVSKMFFDDDDIPCDFVKGRLKFR